MEIAGLGSLGMGQFYGAGLSLVGWIVLCRYMFVRNGQFVGFMNEWLCRCLCFSSPPAYPDIYLYSSFSQHWKVLYLSTPNEPPWTLSLIHI